MKFCCRGGENGSVKMIKGYGLAIPLGDDPTCRGNDRYNSHNIIGVKVSLNNQITPATCQMRVIGAITAVIYHPARLSKAFKSRQSCLTQKR